MNDIILIASLAFFALGAIVHLAIAAGVFSDAAQRIKEKKPVVFLGPILWSLTCLCTGIFGLLLYWLIHHSALRRLYDKDEHGRH